ncbi:hypothetical protein H9X85_05675 [Anaerotignum lactatifermentans]|uniref:Copper amine oxidase-like N-terminal domain-containing protein n=1 Tax=Anaerotignum lactatifermentans TaxID=160404 RepID=A0ABS2G786_9FIRM|nr:hypothetical protein [Anaerotignum lactatifermentans]MBM6877331.1 hypothetical protein [Anaerotignum lactatifermentans]MBM6950702.1 hypothetical protein [Anaerotignum lactatifermentans]
MKKFISFVMAAAMVASLAPATAFAVSNNGEVKATASIINAWSVSEVGNDGEISGEDAPELQLKITSADYKQTSVSADQIEAKFTLTLDNAEWLGTEKEIADSISIEDEDHYDIIGTWNPNATAATETYSYTTDGTGDGSSSGATIVANWKSTTASNQTYGYWEIGTEGTNFVSIDSVVEGLAVQEGEEITGKGVDEQKEALFYQTVDASADYSKWLEVTNWNNTGKDGWVCAENDGTYGSAGEFKALTGTNTEDTTSGLPANVQNFSELKAAVYTAEDVETALDSALDTSVTTSYDYGVRTLTSQTAAKGAYTGGNANGRVGDITVDKIDDDVIEVTIHGKFSVGDVIAVNMDTVMTKTSVNKTATVSIESDLVDADDLVFVSIKEQAVEASIKKTVNVAEEEMVDLYSGGLVIKEAVDGSLDGVDEITLELNKGFEFTTANGVTVESGSTELNVDVDLEDDDTLVITDLSANTIVDGKITVKGIEIEATSASTGDIATITVKAGTMDKVKVEVAEVVDYEVVMSVDEDEDVPVIYSGVDADNTGITDDSDHETLEITLEESFPGAWSSRQGFTITIPEGVYVTDVEIVNQENFFQDGDDMTDAEWEEAFEEAYQDGDHLNFEFAKRVFDDVDTDLNEDPASLTFVLTLVADPGFEGDVEIGFEGSLVESQSVVAATFVSPYTVTAEQNDLKIDSRYTEIPTDIVVTEAADGLWEKGAEFTFQIEKELISFEDDATFTADEDSDMELKTTQSGGTLTFEVKSTSDEAASVTISDMELYMDRNIPTGAYALELYTTMSDAYEAQLLYAYDDTDAATADYGDDLDGDNFVGDITDYSNVVKDSFINVITGTTDGAMFTTKVVVPVGENYLISGDTQIELDVPAYINADGYTMLPVRAVSTALGIDNNSVLWDQDSKTVTILYGQRIISMTYGQKVMYVNGQAIATSSAVEITDDRAFLPMRDLATALGITDITWDDTTKTATLNGGEA